MPEASKIPSNITVIIRSVNRISSAAEITINLASQYVNQILILFSGSEVEYISVSKKYENEKAINVLWVYSFGYLEPIMINIRDNLKDKIRNEWIMILTDRDILSEALLKSLSTLILKDVNGFMVQRAIDDSTANRNIPLWLRNYLSPGFKRGYQPFLYRKDKIVISEVIHTPYKILGKTEYLDPALYYVKRGYVMRDMESDEAFVNHWVEKEVRYIFIEMFETRKSRAAAIAKIIESVPLLRKLHFKLGHHNFLYSELSNFEYTIFELIRAFSMGSIGLTPYQKVKIKTIKDTRRLNSIGFFTSEFLRTKNDSLTSFLGISSVVVDPNKNNFDDLASVENSEYAFIRRLLNRFVETREGWKNTEIEKLIAQVKSFLNINTEIYMPRR